LTGVDEKWYVQCHLQKVLLNLVAKGRSLDSAITH